VWTAASLADQTVDQPSDLQAYAVCYNPRGAVAGANPTLSRAKTSAHSTRVSEIAPADVRRLAELHSKRH